MNPRSLCVVGNINRDLKSTPLAPNPSLFEDGETGVDRIFETIGGGGANSACIAAALGAKTRFVGKVGDDPLGRRLLETMRRAGVDPAITIDAETETGTSIALSFAGGQRHFLSSLPNNLCLKFEDLRLDDLGAYQDLLRADLWFSEEMLYGGNARLFRLARELRVRTSIDLNWDPAWSSKPKSEIKRRKAAVRSLLPLVDLVHGNIRELNKFAESEEIEVTLRRLLEWGAGAVVLHMGRAGSGYFDQGGFISEPAVLIATPGPSTGSGDVLSVCMLLSEGAGTVPERLKRANEIVSEFLAGRRALIPELV